jgi:hypothetical protein
MNKLWLLPKNIGVKIILKRKIIFTLISLVYTIF